MKKQLTICILVLSGVLFCLNANAVLPQYSSNWADFTGVIQYRINNNYASIIYDTDDDGLCETDDLTGATQVAVSVKGTWDASTYFLGNASTSLGFAMPEPSYRARGLCLRYYSSGYYIEPANAFFYQAGGTPTPTPSTTPPVYLSDIASDSLDILPVYAYMTAGDLGIMLGLFALVMLTLLAMLWRKNKFS